jgi:chromosomal replication initiator protein
LIDDIQFIAGRDSTQEEFFHTFNALYNSGKQIIISSDRPPKEIAKLEERLSSRFSSGLIADLQKPDIDTRIAILRQKASECALDVDDEVLQMIAEKVDSNIRELEGTLTRLSAYMGLVGSSYVTPELAKEALKEVFQEHQPRSVTVDDIIDAVCEYYAITRGEILGKRRNRSIALPRQMAMYLSRQLTGASLPSIGDSLGGRDHSTILHGCNKIEELLETMPTIQAAKNDIIKRLNV